MFQGVCVLGDAAVDLIVHLPEYRNGEKVMPYEPCLYPGGSGANTAVALSRLGMPTQFIGKIGKDQFGQIVNTDFIAEKVCVDQLFVDPELSTICVLAFVDEDGERYLSEWPKVKKAYTSIEFNDIDLDLIRKAGWLHITGLLLSRASCGRDTTLEVMAWAKNNGVITSLDLNLRLNGDSIDFKYHDILINAISNSQYVLGSEKEISLLLDSHDWEKSAKSLANLNKVAIVRRGKGGSVLFSKGQRIESPAFQVDIVDTIGAGDVFNAGFITALYHDKDFATALQWGNAVAGYKISRVGARTSPTLEQLQDFIDTLV